jgi:hypothetical protein
MIAQACNISYPGGIYQRRMVLRTAQGRDVSGTPPPQEASLAWYNTSVIAATHNENGTRIAVQSSSGEKAQDTI